MTEIPAWAAKTLDRTLAPGNPILNARRLGPNKVLANTQLGAVLVRRGLFSGTRIEFLEVPSEKLAFQCAGCQENLQFLNLSLPKTVYCSICATPYDVDAHGEVTTAGRAVEATRELPNLARDAATSEATELAAEPVEASGACCEQSGCCATGCDTAACCAGEACECCVAAIAAGTASEPAAEATRAPATVEAAATADGAFTHAGYTLYRRDVETKSGSRPLYFFSKGGTTSGTPVSLPDGYEVGVNGRTGLPFLRKAEAQAREAKGRGATGYHGDTHGVLAIEGIGAGHRARLEAAGVRTTDELYRANARALAKAIDVPLRTVQEWQVMAELLMVKGIGPQYAEAMALAGIAGIEELKKRSGAAIAKQVNAFLDRQEVRLVGTPLSPARVEAWKNAAKAMRKATVEAHALA